MEAKLEIKVIIHKKKNHNYSKLYMEKCGKTIILNNYNYIVFRTKYFDIKI